MCPLPASSRHGAEVRHSPMCSVSTTSKTPHLTHFGRCERPVPPLQYSQHRHWQSLMRPSVHNATWAPMSSRLQRLEGLDILLVDDEPGILHSMRRNLQSEGAVVLTAPDGLAALALVEARPPGILVTDVHMPRMDGHELVARARSLQPTLPIIVCSGSPREEDHVSFRQSTRLRFLPKPYSVSSLIVAIESLALPNR